MDDDGVLVGLRDRLSADLRAAMAARDRPAVTALRTTLAAIANAEAIAMPEGSYDPTLSLGSDRPRRELTETDMRAILAAEIDQHETGIATYERLGQAERAGRLRAERDVLARYR